ncbi:endonuclease NucS domain-containing protein [uncultured Marixanthomonas sp.]|uniref:endonuclease NucS domain-containing protein n=1 Tax=uncultured Marixanthomonas sp. TaxID=757245 RepID=UPI0030D84767|tara:strand:- start:130723 stop:132093 length:1371 start_codon:yes stop_codon:yes gene_type:complete
MNKNRKLINSDSLAAFYKAAVGVKETFTDKKLSQLISAFEHTYVEDLLVDIDQARKALEGLPVSFYDHLATNFSDNLNSIPEFWLILDCRLYEVLTPETATYINTKILKEASGTNAEYLYKGVTALDSETPDLALLFFGQIEHYIAAYFIGFSYIQLENYPNAIKSFLEFNKGLKEFIATSKIPEIDKNPSLLFFKWEVAIELGYLYNANKEYDKALQKFDEALCAINLEDTYYILSEKSLENTIENQFEIFLNNFLFTLEKTTAYKKAVTLLESVLEFNPNHTGYIQQLQNFKERLKRHKTANTILRNIIPVKKPFNIQEFTKTQLVAREKNLEDMIVEQIKYGYEVFGKKLEIYQDETIYGRQYYIKAVNGILDLLLIDKATDTLYLVELKRNLAGVEVVTQLESYMEGLATEINKTIRGITCLHQPNPELTALIKQKENIELFTYHFDFKKLG